MGSRRRIVFIVLVGAVLGLLIGAEVSIAWVCVALWVTVGVVGWAVVASDRLSGSAVSPVLIVGGLGVIYGTVVPIVLASKGETFLAGVDYRPWFWTASAICALAVVAFIVGYALAAPRHTPPDAVTELAVGAPVPSTNRSGSLIDRVAKILGLVAGGLILYRFARYGVGGWAIRLGEDRTAESGVSAYVTYAPQYFGGLLLYLFYRVRSTALRRLCAALVLLLAFYFFATGVRYLVITMISALALLHYWRKRRRLLPPARSLLAVLVVGSVILGVGGYLRTKSQFGAAATGIQESAARSFDVFLPLAGLVPYTGQAGYLFGTSYAYLGYQVIPRSVWPGKPLPPTVTAIAGYTDVREGRAFPVWGEMFLNFGWYGVAFGMGFFGYGVRKLMQYWLRHRLRFVTLDVLAAISIPLLLQWTSRGLFVQLVYNTMGLMVGALIVFALERRLVRGAARGQVGSRPVLITSGEAG